MIKKYPLPIMLGYNCLNEANHVLLNDFINFKKENELNYCTFNQRWLAKDIVETTWTTTIRFNSSLNESGELENRYNNLINTSDHSYISKITCQESIYIAEISVIRHYIISHQ